MAVSPDPAAVLFEAATAGISQPSEQFVLPRASILAAPTVQWLWPGHILGGKLTLIDARGGSGKTRLALGIMACLSRGSWPFGIGGDSATCDPARGMLITSEDDPEDSAATYAELGGDLDQLILHTTEHGDLTIHDDGLNMLESIIVANQLKLVVYDPILQFMPASVRGQTDNQGITQALARLQMVARRTGAAIVMIRHWAMMLTAREVNQLGAGGESWRNSSRGQWILFPHPENATRRDWTQVLVVSGRNTQRVRYERFFGMEIDRGRQTFIHPNDVTIEPYVEAFPSLGKYLGVTPVIDSGSRGPASNKRNAAAETIMSFVKDAGGFKRKVIDYAIEQGHAKPTVYRAFDALVETGHITVGANYQVYLAEIDDPFADDAPEEWWAK